MAKNVYAQEYSRSRAQPIFIGVAAAVFLLTFATVALVTYIRPESFSSSAYLKVEPEFVVIETNQQKVAQNRAYFVRNQIGIMQSEVILQKVVQQLNLTTEWGKKYTGGEPFKVSECVAMLRGRVKIPETESTSVEIRVYSDEPKEAAILANTMADVYATHVREREKEQLEVSRAQLKPELVAHENKVRAAQAELDALRKSLNLTERDALSSEPIATLDTNTVRQLRTDLISYETTLTKQRIQWAQVKEFSPEHGVDAFVTVVGEDAELSAALKKLRAAKEKEISIQKELLLRKDDTEPPALVNARAVGAEASKQIDARVVEMKSSFSNRVAGTEASVAAINQKLDAARKTDAGKVERTRPYYEAKARLEELKGLERTLRTRVASDEVNLTARVEIVDRATPPTRPVSTNRSRKLFYGGGGAAILGLIIGSLAAWLFSPRRVLR